MIKTVFFDVDGTLLDFKKAEENALAGLRDFMKLKIQPDEFKHHYHRVNDQLWTELEQGLISGEELKSERFIRFSKRLDSDIDPEKLSSFYLQALGEGAFFLERARELLDVLKGKFRLAIITNGLTTVQEPRLKTLGFYELFDTILISEKEGCAKPDAALFRLGAERMGIELDDSVMIVGDSLTSDIAGGINAGIKTCWYNPERWKNNSPNKPDFEIDKLMDLIEILNQVQDVDKLSR